ncbi:MAG: SpoIIE family protein phosphatase [Proteobacteria bacterium]|nr:SpoIIE family protein phosphatase [Pseudomonadota bacterium]
MILVPVTEISQVAEGRRAAVVLAEQNGFDAEAAGRVAIVATELATNLVKHAPGGHLILATFDGLDGSAGIEIIAIDKGPGISDLAVALADGLSTAGTAGNGLGAVKRQSESFEIFSQSGHGTAIVSRILAKRPSLRFKDAAVPLWGAICVPFPGETVSGDAWSVRVDEASQTVMVVDGLGHGPDAARVATDATRLFNKYWKDEPAEIVRSLHAGLRSTRGGAVAVARIEPVRNRIVFAGVGNISGSILASDGDTRRMMSHNGTIGHNARNIQQISYPLEKPSETSVVLHSDGIGTSWAATAYPGLLNRSPILLAAVLYRDFSRGRDDATVLVTKGSLS